MCVGVEMLLVGICFLKHLAFRGVLNFLFFLRFFSSSGLEGIVFISRVVRKKENFAVETHTGNGIGKCRATKSKKSTRLSYSLFFFPSLISSLVSQCDLQSPFSTPWTLQFLLAARMVKYLNRISIGDRLKMDQSLKY